VKKIDLKYFEVQKRVARIIDLGKHLSSMSETKRWGKTAGAVLTVAVVDIDSDYKLKV